MTELDPVNAKFVSGLLQADLRNFGAFAASFEIVKEFAPANEDYPGGWIIRAISVPYDYRADYDQNGDRWEVVHGNIVRSYTRLGDAIAEMFKDL